MSSSDGDTGRTTSSVSDFSDSLLFHINILTIERIESENKIPGKVWSDAMNMEAMEQA